MSDWLRLVGARFTLFLCCAWYTLIACVFFAFNA